MVVLFRSSALLLATSTTVTGGLVQFQVGFQESLINGSVGAKLAPVHAFFVLVLVP